MATSTSIFDETGSTSGYIGSTVADDQATEGDTVTLSDFRVYMVCEVVVGLLAIVGNTLVIIAFKKERRLRRLTNYYIVSLAVADLLVGLLGIPCAILAKMGQPRHFYLCLFTLSLLVVLCTISIFSLVAVSIDRYWAILYPMGYARNVSTKKAICIIGICWVLGSFVGFLPLLGWNAGTQEACYFMDIMDENFLVFLYLATIVFPALLMGVFYAHIYTVVLKQLRAILTVNGMSAGDRSMLRVLGAARKRDVKATKNLSIIVLFFVLCWFPLYTLNFINAFYKEFVIPNELMDSCIILSHLNSAGNPLLYAYHLTDFRSALRSLLTGDSGLPDSKPELLSTVRLKVDYKAPNSTPKLPHRIYTGNDSASIMLNHDDHSRRLLRVRGSMDSNAGDDSDKPLNGRGNPT